jgi:peptidoglycan/LPS O-acetylase OafA/YrhL
LLPESVSGASVALFLSLAASMLLYRLIESPIDRWRQNRFEKARQTIDEPGVIQAIS